MSIANSMLARPYLSNLPKHFLEKWYNLFTALK